jgi:hypothetical protein
MRYRIAALCLGFVVLFAQAAQAAITKVQASVAAAANGAMPVSVSLGSTPTNGDVLFAFFADNGSTGNTPPTGFVGVSYNSAGTVRFPNGGSQTAYAYTCVVITGLQCNTTGPYTFTAPANGQQLVILTEYSGVDQNNPLDRWPAGGYGAQAASTTYTTSSENVGYNAGGLALALMYSASTQVWTAGSGMTIDANTNGTSTSIMQEETTSQVLTAFGATLTATATAGTSTAGLTGLFFLRPASSFNQVPATGAGGPMSSAGTGGPVIPTHVLTWAYTGSFGSQAASFGCTDGNAGCSGTGPNATGVGYMKYYLTYCESNGTALQMNVYVCDGLGSDPTSVAYTDIDNIHTTDGAPDTQFYAAANSGACPGNADKFWLHTAAPYCVGAVSQNQLRNSSCGGGSPCQFPNLFGNNNTANWYSTNLLQGSGAGGCVSGNSPLTGTPCFPTTTFVFYDTASGKCQQQFINTTGQQPDEYGGGTSDTAGCDSDLMQGHLNLFANLKYGNGTLAPVFANYGAGDGSYSNIPTEKNTAFGCATDLGNTITQPWLGGFEEKVAINGAVVVPQGYSHMLNDASLTLYSAGCSGTKFVLDTQSTATLGGAIQIAQEMVSYALFMIEYTPDRTVLNALWAQGQANSGRDYFMAYPLEGLVPLYPLSTMTVLASPTGQNASGCTTTGAFDVTTSGAASGSILRFCGKVSTGPFTPGSITSCGSGCVGQGGYAREFGSCYYYGVSIGRCAALVNGTDTAQNVSAFGLTNTYAHQITIDGGDVLTDACGTSGCALGTPLNDTTAASGTTSVAAGAGLILVQ